MPAQAASVHSGQKIPFKNPLVVDPQRATRILGKKRLEPRELIVGEPKSIANHDRTSVITAPKEILMGPKP